MTSSSAEAKDGNEATHKKIPVPVNTSTLLSVPDPLLKRILPDDCKGFLLNEEVALLALLDKKGQLTEAARMNDFMFLLTRIETMEGKMLYLDVLQKRLTEELLQHFILHGGYRLLRRWIDTAHDQEDLYIIVKLIEVCRMLPFDLQAIKTSEIGKSIKALTQFESESYTSDEHAMLKKEVSMIMKEWKAAQEIKREEERKLKEEQQAAERAALNSTESAEGNNEELAAASTASTASTIAPSKSKQASSTASTESKGSGEVKVRSKPEGTRLLNIPMTVSNTAFSIPTLSSSSFTPQTTFAFDSLPAVSSSTSNNSGSNESKVSTDINEGARKLLARKAFANPANYSNPAAESPVPVTASTVPNAHLQPLAKGGLKKKDSNAASVAAAAAVSKKGTGAIRWADEEGGTLREVQYFEVERIKAQVARYKSHKELVKREKQLEKDAYLSKATEVMHATTIWRKPKSLQLSVEIIDNVGEPTGSLEINTQNKRIANMMETKYLDESLIPNDPDHSMSHADLQAFLRSVDAGRDVEVIPWLMEGEIDEDAGKQQNTYISSSSGASTPSISSSSSMTGAMIFDSNSLLATPTSAAMLNEVDYNTRINNLPPELQKLDPMTLQLLLNDTSGQILRSLILPDGQINEKNFHILQNCFTGQEYLDTIAFQSNILLSTSLLNNPSLLNNNIPPPPVPPNLSSYFTQNNLSSLPASLLNLASLPNLANSLVNTIGSNWTINTPVANPAHVNKNSFVSSLLGNPSLPPSSSNMGRPNNSKASIPCKFFNNSGRGCMNGDKCPFGHFRENGASGAVGNANRGGGGGGSGPGKGPGHRPGMRHHNSLNNNTPDRSINKKPRLG